MTEVCLDVGFNSLGTFSRTFRDIVGEAPSTYRRRGDGQPGPCRRASPWPGRGRAASEKRPRRDGASDCRGTYEELRARGVEFTQEPIERDYGIDCGLRDPFGNAIRIVQPAA